MTGDDEHVTLHLAHVQVTLHTTSLLHAVLPLLDEVVSLALRIHSEQQTDLRRRLRMRSTFQCLCWYARTRSSQLLQHSPSLPAPKQSPQLGFASSTTEGSSLCLVASSTSSFVGTVIVIYSEAYGARLQRTCCARQ